MAQYAIYSVFITQLILLNSANSKKVNFLYWLAGGCIMGMIYPLLDGQELNLFNFLLHACTYLTVTFFMILEIIISIISAWNHRVSTWILNFLTILSIMLSIIGNSYKEDKEEKKMVKIRSQELINHKADKLSKNSGLAEIFLDSKR